MRKTFKMKDKDLNKPIKDPQRTQGRRNVEITVTNILRDGGEDIVPIKHKMLRKRTERERGALSDRRTAK